MRAKSTGRRVQRCQKSRKPLSAASAWHPRGSKRSFWSVAGFGRSNSISFCSTEYRVTRVLMLSKSFPLALLPFGVCCASALVHHGLAAEAEAGFPPDRRCSEGPHGFLRRPSRFFARLTHVTALAVTWNCRIAIPRRVGACRQSN
jgi:hypothetical protein